MTRAFGVTYEIITPESAEQGDADERGWIAESCSLRDALRWVRETRTCHCDGITGIEPSEYPGDGFRWITVDNGAEFLTGAHESRSLHIPDRITPATRRRILRCVEQGVA